MSVGENLKFFQSTLRYTTSSHPQQTKSCLLPDVLDSRGGTKSYLDGVPQRRLSRQTSRMFKLNGFALEAVKNMKSGHCGLQFEEKIIYRFQKNEDI